MRRFNRVWIGGGKSFRSRGRRPGGVALRWFPFGALALALLLAALATAGRAETISLADGNTGVSINPTSASGMSQWVVDSTNYLTQNSFWYRIGSSGAIQPVSVLSLVSASVFDLAGDGLDDAAVVKYKNGQGLNITFTYSIIGGQPGSGTSDVNQQIQISNTGAQPLNLQLFQYSQLGLSAGDDTLQFVGSSQVLQTAASIGSIDTVVTGTQAPSAYEAIDPAAWTTSPSLDDAAGPVSGNVASAWEWNMSLAKNGSFVIGEQSALNLSPSAPVPEPSTIVLLGMGAVAGLFFTLRKRLEARL